jgi:catechol 2,3-dioxygenase-like lactoylglutathione lyase family enzyme
MTDDRDWRIDNTGIGVSDIHRSARFYETALRSLGVKIVMRVTRGFEPIEDESTDLGGVDYGTDYPVFWIDVFHPHSVKQHVPFRAQRRQQVDAFHEAALLGGRPQSFPNRGFLGNGDRPCLQIVFPCCRLTSSAIGCRRSAGAGPTRLNPVPLLAQVKPWMSP